MAEKPEPPKPIIWNIYKIASKAIWLGNVAADSESEAIDKGAQEFRMPANRLIANSPPASASPPLFVARSTPSPRAPPRIVARGHGSAAGIV